MHQVSWVPQPYADRLHATDLADASLYAVLADHGVAVARASEVIRAGVVDPKVARHLSTAPGTAVLVSERVTRTVDGAAVVVDLAVILGDLMEIRAERATNALSLRWRPVPA